MQRAWDGAIVVQEYRADAFARIPVGGLNRSNGSNLLGNI
jgi:hypothetical protein